MNDPERLFFPHLQRIKPELESVFERAFLSVPLATAVAQADYVDWLAWEDPFILNCDAAQLKRERENSLAETQKRLSYALPMMEILADTSREHKRDLMW